MVDNKPSFLGSMMSGVGGYVKGLLAGGAIGAITGGILGAVVTLGNPLGIAAGAAIGGATLGGIGALAGTVTGVVKAREAQAPAAQDVVNLANITFAQGVATGQQLEHAKGGFRARLEAERANQTQRTR
jgi:hypothetical protein